MTDIIQYSVLLLRDDLESDVPGAPISETPLVFEEGLQDGEVAFTRDTGRLFAGHTPTPSQPHFHRTSFPYENVEVFTENSAKQFNEMVGAVAKDFETEASHTATLPQNTSFADVLISINGASYPYRIEGTSSVAVLLDYAAFDSSGVPIKSGEIRIMHGDGVARPKIVDIGHSTTAGLTFETAITGPVGGEYITLRYKNQTGSNLVLKFNSRRVTFIKPSHRNVTERSQRLVETLQPLTLAGGYLFAPSGTRMASLIGSRRGSTLEIVSTDFAANKIVLSGTGLFSGTSRITRTSGLVNLVVRETLEGATNSPFETLIKIGPAEAHTVPDLVALTLSNDSVAENSSAGTFVGFVQNQTGGSVITLTNNAGGKFALSGNSLIVAGALNYATAQSHTIEITETLEGIANSPKVTSLTVYITPTP